MYFREIENFAYGEINERSFSNPHPWCTDTYKGFSSRGDLSSFQSE